MSFCFHATIAIVLVSLAVALPSQPGSFPPDLDHGGVPLATHEGDGKTFGDIRVASSLVSRNAGPLISCDGSKYRTGLKVMSCQDAVDQIPQDAKSLRFAYRRGEYDVALPSRFISCEYWKVICYGWPDQADDGLCTIDIVLKDGVTFASASYQELSRAANALLRRCVVPNQSGGIAMSMGEATAPFT